MFFKIKPCKGPLRSCRVPDLDRNIEFSLPETPISAKPHSDDREAKRASDLVVNPAIPFTS